jgi:hypothetical protein
VAVVVGVLVTKVIFIMLLALVVLAEAVMVLEKLLTIHLEIMVAQQHRGETVVVGATHLQGETRLQMLAVLVVMGLMFHLGLEPELQR